MCEKISYADATCSTCRMRLSKKSKTVECPEKLAGKKCKSSSSTAKVASHTCPKAKKK